MEFCHVSPFQPFGHYRPTKFHKTHFSFNGFEVYVREIHHYLSYLPKRQNDLCKCCKCSKRHHLECHPPNKIHESITWTTNSHPLPAYSQKQTFMPYVLVHDKTKKEIISILAGKSVDMTDINHGYNIVN